MTVSNQQLLQRMNKEVEEALLKHDDTSRVREHVRAVKLLCDLVLEEETSVTTESPQPVQNNTEPTAEEIRKMMGEEPPKSKSKKEDPGHEGANGSSIFDF